MKKSRIFSLLLFPFSLLSILPIHAQEVADMVLINGNIITVSPNNDIVEALAIKDSMFIKVGTNFVIDPYIGDETEIIDLGGKTVTPGLIDAHTHLMYYGQAENEYVNLRPPEVTSIAEIVAKIEERVAQIEDGEWIVGDGFFMLEDQRMPTKYDLDPVSPNNPVILNSMGGHFGTVNSNALDIAGVTASTPNPTGGIIEKDTVTGEPTGVLWNHPAMDVVRLHMPPYDPQLLIEDVQYAQEYYLPFGITSFQDVNTRGLGRLYAYGQNAINNDLKIRGYLLFTIEHPSDVDLCLDNTQLYRFPMLAYGGNKFLLDGQPPTSFTYESHPGPSWNMPTWNYDSLEVAVKRLHREGRQCSFHVMGDAAIDMALDAIEAAQNDTLIPNIRHRLEHVMIPTYESLQRMKELDVLVCMQPAAIYTAGEFYFYYWGPERIQRLMPLRSMIDTGLHVSLGSDYPTVPSLDPRLALWSAMTRKTSSGNIINEDEGITIREALYAHTIEAAYAAFEEDLKGSIEVGKYADMTVWTDNLYEQAVDEILENEIVMTIVGGTLQGPAGLGNHYQTKEQCPFSLNYAVPNPFKHTTEISFHVNESSTDNPLKLKLAVYNILGEKVKTLAEQKFAPGDHKYIWDGTDEQGNRVHGTVYFIKLTSGKHADVERVIMIGK